MIDKAVKGIFGIKKRHHDKIVDALEAGASESEHIAMLDEKRRDVLQAMQEAGTCITCGVSCMPYTSGAVNKTRDNYNQ